MKNDVDVAVDRHAPQWSLALHCARRTCELHSWLLRSYPCLQPASACRFAASRNAAKTVGKDLPTAMGLPISEGSSRIATAAKKKSMSTLKVIKRNIFARERQLEHLWVHSVNGIDSYCSKVSLIEFSFTIPICTRLSITLHPNNARPNAPPSKYNRAAVRVRFDWWNLCAYVIHNANLNLQLHH